MTKSIKYYQLATPWKRYSRFGLLCLVALTGIFSCTKEVQKPIDPPQPRWIVINVDYAAQTGVNYVTLNGKQIMGTIVAGQVKVDSVDNPEGELIINLSGGGGGDFIAIQKQNITIPYETVKKDYSFQISGYSLISIGKH